MATPMAVEKSFSGRSSLAPAWRRLIAAAVVVAVGWGGVVYAANNSVQGAKKEEGGFDGDAPTAMAMAAAISLRHARRDANRNVRESAASDTIGDALSAAF